MDLEQRIQKIEQRNKKVELDKAWETSSTRRWVIMILTYFIAAWFMYLIDVKDYWTNALVPVIGYLLSTLSIPIARKYWTKYYYNDHEKI